MRTLHISLALAVFATASSGCYFANIDALEDKMIDECHIAPLGPSCAIDDEEGERAVFERFASRQVHSFDTERCLLNVDCDEDRISTDPDGAIDDIGACLTRGDGPLDKRFPFSDPDLECVAACDSAVISCGEQLTHCDRDVVDNCFAEHEDCINDCPDA